MWGCPCLTVQSNCPNCEPPRDMIPSFALLLSQDSSQQGARLPLPYLQAYKPAAAKAATFICNHRRNTYMIWEYHMVMLLINHINVLCIKLCVNDGSYAQYIYMIDPEAQSYILPNHASIPPTTDTFNHAFLQQIN